MLEIRSLSASDSERVSCTSLGLTRDTCTHRQLSAPYHVQASTGSESSATHHAYLPRTPALRVSTCGIIHGHCPTCRAKSSARTRDCREIVGCVCVSQWGVSVGDCRQVRTRRRARKLRCSPPRSATRRHPCSAPRADTRRLALSATPRVVNPHLWSTSTHRSDSTSSTTWHRQSPAT